MTEPTRLLTVEEPMVRAMLDRSQEKNWGDRVLAIAALPTWPGEKKIRHQDRDFKIWPCTSVLAVRDALRHRHSAVQPIILTDLTRTELGVGICEHLAYAKPMAPDVIVALRDLFHASRQESQLLRLKDSAAAVLRQLGSQGVVVPPAPGGVLTRALLLGAVASSGFGLSELSPTATDVLIWSNDRACTSRFRDWLTTTDPALVTDLLDWLGDGLEAAAGPIVAALRAGRAAELIPLGLAAGLLHPDGPDGAEVGTGPSESELRVRLEQAIGLQQRPTDVAWTTFAQTALTAVDRLITRPRTDLGPVFELADRLVTGALHSAALAGRSDYLPSALAQRVHLLASAGLAALGSGALTPEVLLGVESVWLRVAEHHQARMATPDPLVKAALAAVRLLRYLATAPGGTVSTRARDLAVTYLDHQSWVDAAVNDASQGSNEPELAALSADVLTRVRALRWQQDRAAAGLLPSLTHATPDGPLYIEQILDRVVAPIAGTGPVLLLVLDGMSAAAVHDVLRNVTSEHAAAWQEAELPGDVRAAVAVFPTVTDRSRCSLFSGHLTEGKADTERKNFASWLRGNGRVGVNSGPTLFHKSDLDMQADGYDLPLDVRAAMDDTTGRPVIGAILNTIDDAIHRADPLGTDWGPAHIPRLGPLLAAAARVGRVVVLTSDHGHVIERRERGKDRRSEDKQSRWRTPGGEPTGADEVLLAGPRVLTATNSAVLAVDEQLRYSNAGAGYHGGAALAEFVVPVAILVSGEIDQAGPLRQAANRVPIWWQQGSVMTAAVPVVAPRAVRKAPAVPVEPQLFVVPGADAAAAEAVPVVSAATGDSRLAKLLAGKQFTVNLARFGRGSLDLDRVRALLAGLINSGGSVSLTTAAAALDVPVRRAPRVLAVVSQIVNVDGVAVLSQDPSQVTLAADLLFEQFGVSR